MNRRQHLQSLGLISAHAVFPAVLSGFLTRCAGKETGDYSYQFLDSGEVETLVEVMDIIIPPTTTRSASEVNVQHFLDEIFAKCLTSDQQQIIKEGLVLLRSDLKSAPDKKDYLIELDKRAYAGEENAVYFKTIKQYTMIGFFTSQEGTTRASNYVKVPEAYKGEVPVTANTLNYGRTNLRFYL